MDQTTKTIITISLVCIGVSALGIFAIYALNYVGSQQAIQKQKADQLQQCYSKVDSTADNLYGAKYDNAGQLVTPAQVDAGNSFKAHEYDYCKTHYGQ